MNMLNIILNEYAKPNIEYKEFEISTNGLVTLQTLYTQTFFINQ